MFHFPEVFDWKPRLSGSKEKDLDWVTQLIKSFDLRLWLFEIYQVQRTKVMSTFQNWLHLSTYFERMLHLQTVILRLTLEQYHYDFVQNSGKCSMNLPTLFSFAIRQLAISASNFKNL